MSSMRNPSGGLIDRSKPLSFVFNGDRYHGHPGDSLASALLANGVRLVGRSFKYHRPRGIYSIGAEEACALVDLEGEPNTKATQVELVDGLVARSQNGWPSVGFDLLSVNDRMSRLLAAGFYYKTFMSPRRLWPFYERFIRKAAGLGKAPAVPDRHHYEQRFAHCDVLVVGAGPAGLSAARSAAETEARVMLVDDAPTAGGWLRRENLTLEDMPGYEWATQMVAALENRPNVTLLTRATAFGYYDHNLVAVVERSAVAKPQHQPAQCLWRIRARQVVLATGAFERPLVFRNNDRPGVMLAGAARGYLNEFAVRPGRCAIVFTNNDSAYRTAIDLHAGGVEVAAVVDVRDEVAEELRHAVEERGIRLAAGSVLTNVLGRNRVTGVEIAPVANARLGPSRRRDCDVVCVSGGWSPALHLHAQSGGRPVYEPGLLAFAPGDSKQPERSAGSARGIWDTTDCLRDGERAGVEAARACGFKSSLPVAPLKAPSSSIEALWSVADPHGRGKRFVDLQNDVTVEDVALAHREGYAGVEHLKRYTTLGMGTDQGKTSNLTGWGLLAGYRGEEMGALGTTTFRPPFVPVSMGALAGRQVGPHLEPSRRTSIHAQHEDAGARFAPNGLWLRPQFYPVEGEDAEQAIHREVLAVRNHVGITDVSTLGKIELAGPNAVEFLNRLYINDFSRVPVGRARYGLMLREDGMIFDDGAVTRIDEDRFFVTTSTGNAEAVLQHFEYWRNVVFSDLELCLIPVTEQWSTVSLAGPDSRATLEKLTAHSLVTSDGLPHMGLVSGKVADCEARILRVSFSGETGFEIYVPASDGARLWTALVEAGQSFGIVPYGMDAMEVLRIEKGFIGVGAEADGRATPYDVGYERLIGQHKKFVGKHGLARPAFHEPDRLQLVGLESIDHRSPIGQGAQILQTPGSTSGGIGHLTSAAFSPTLDRPVALAMLASGRSRTDDTVYVTDPIRGHPGPVPARVVSPCFYDPKGERLK